MAIILGAIGDVARSQDIGPLAVLLDQDVVWEGVRPDQRCDGRDEAMRVIGGFFSHRRLTFDAVELQARGDTVVVGMHGPGLTGTPGDFETVGQVFHVFTLRDGAVIRWKAYLDRSEALAAVESDGPLPAPAHPTVEMPSAGDRAVRRLVMPGEVMRIGRTPDNDLVLADLAVSRHHAEVRRSPAGTYEVIDLNSHNGTYVNGKRVSRAMLTEQDIVSIGSVTFCLAAG